MIRIKIVSLIFLGASLPAVAIAERNVHFTGDFESGQVNPKESRKDGFFIHTLPNVQSGGASFSSGQGGFGPDCGLDTRVVQSEVVEKELIKPRRGDYFIRSALYFDKDYLELNDGTTKNKPRSKIYVSHQENGVQFDEEGYLGFSIYLPKSWEHETGVTGDRGSAMLLQVQSDGASAAAVTLRVYVPKGKSEAHWIMTHNVSDTEIKGGDRTVYDLGSVEDDLGMWTDFVLRYRFNPFSTKVNARSAARGKDQVYEGNKGILQLWKAEGPADDEGNRKLHLTSVNLENEPVGLVPHPTETIAWHFRVYKYGWHHNPTDVEGPVWVGFDEIRDGRVLKDHTTYSDVNPSGKGCTNECPDGTVAAEEPERPPEAEEPERPPKGPMPPMPPGGVVATD